MTISRRRQHEWRIVAIVSVSSAIVSALFGYRIAPLGTEPLWSALQGVANSTLIATPIVLVEVRRHHIAFLRRLRRLPLAAYLAIKVLFYLVVIVGGLTITDLAFRSVIPRQAPIDSLFRVSFVFGVGMAVFGNLAFEMGGLLGYGTLKNFLTGRYVQPRREQRVLLLVDMKDSTGHAERLGPIRFHELLNDFFRDVSDAALECDAEIHKYVGDEAILTWPLEQGVEDGICLVCPFLVRDNIAARRDHYLDRFAIVAEFRASLHCGEIVAGEIGDVRREIAYVGDTINVAARLLAAARDVERDVLASADLLERAALPPDLRAEPLPTLAVRGRSAPLGISALERV